MFPVGFFPTRLFPLGYFPEASQGSTLAPGSVSLVSVNSSTIVLNATEATGGTGPYTHQYERSISPLGPFSNVGTNSLGLTDSGLSQSTAYFYRLTYTDSLGATVTAVFTATTQAASSTALTVITISKTLTFASSQGAISAGNGCEYQGETVAVFGEYKASSGTLQIMGEPTFSVADIDHNLVVDGAIIPLESSGADVSVLVNYLLNIANFDTFKNPFRVWFDANLLDMNGQIQHLQCVGTLEVKESP